MRALGGECRNSFTELGLVVQKGPLCPEFRKMSEGKAARKTSKMLNLPENQNRSH